MFTQVNIIVSDSLLADYRNHGSHCIFRNSMRSYLDQFYSGKIEDYNKMVLHTTSVNSLVSQIQKKQ